MKQRFSSLDVKVIAHELSTTITSLRVSNIYDLSSRIFLFKLAKPDTRKQLIVDSGFRCHLTEYSRTTAAHPSHFVSRLRKYLRSRRVTGVSQVGTDRIIDFEFSDGRYHLFLEFYAGGNIVLTDNEYNILALFRVVSEGTSQEELRVGLKYSLSDKQNYEGIPPLSMERMKDSLLKAKEKEQSSQAAPKMKKPKNKQANVLRQALSMGFPEFPPLLLDHAFEIAGYDSTLRPGQILEDEALLESLMRVLQEAENVDRQLSTAETPTGYIIAKTGTGSKETSSAETSAKRENVLYNDFHPFRPQQFNEKPEISILEFKGYNKTVDEFFSSVESQKLESRLTEREEHAKRKLDSARQDHEKRLGALQETQELHIRKAQAIEANLFRVEEAMTAVNGLIAQGMDWVEIARLIEMEQGRQNPVAKTIKLPLKLYENTVTLLLSESAFEEDEEDEPDKSGSDEDDESDSDDEKAQKANSTQQQVLSIDIDLGMSPWANSRQYYNQKKSAAAKQEKTLQSSTKALKSTEKKVTADLKKGLKQEKQVLRPARKPFWFEKFIFFISSDGYLVLGGRDASQNDILYRQYLKKGDLFVHADLEGAIPVIIKNKIGAPDSPIPPGTLAQAGTLSVATSSAWDSKAVIAAWWVNAEQVSKMAPTGDYLGPGNFFVKGQKNFLPPAQLVLGFAVLFHINEESLAHHTKHRLQDDEGVEQASANQADTVDAQSTVEPGVKEEEHKDEDDDDMESESGSEDEGDEAEESVNPLQNKSNSQQSRQKEVGNVDSKADGDDDDDDYEEEQEEGDNEELNDNNSPAQTTEQGKQLPGHQRKVSFASTAPSQSSTPSQAKKTLASHARGKKGKNKKLAAKYAHQDEEDRELALRLLGSGTRPDKAAEAAKAKEIREAEAEAQKQRRRAQHDRIAEAERQRQLAFADSERAGDGGDPRGQDLTESEIADMACIPCLIGTPVPGDEILAAVPVCAPWTALARCKFRTKLQPGTTKKGKAVKEMLGRWISDATAATSSRSKRGKKPDIATDGTAPGDEADGQDGSGGNVEVRELELIKGWRDVEVVNTVPVGKVRVVASGGGGGGGDKGKDGKGKGNAKKGGGKGGRGSKKQR